MTTVGLPDRRRLQVEIEVLEERLRVSSLMCESLLSIDSLVTGSDRRRLRLEVEALEERLRVSTLTVHTRAAAP